MGPSTKQEANTPTLAAILRDAVRRSGLSVYKIAKDSGVDQSTLNKFLNGGRDNLRLDIADRLFRYFGLRVVTAAKSKSTSRDA
jgi:plasmid maintenance system antidote protein VapI